MDKTNDTTEHRNGQHLTSEELAYTSRIPIHPVKKGRWNVIIGCCEDLFQKAKALMTTLRMKS